MFLVKCECGCFYTLDKDKLRYPHTPKPRECPNCGANHDLDDNPTLEALSKTGMAVIPIPDGVQIEVKFTLESFPLQTPD